MLKGCSPLLILCLVLSGVTVAQNDSGKFRYSDNKAIPVGMVLHYVKSNIDGSKPEYVSQYVADRETLEAFKFHPKSFPAALVIAKMDWRAFSAASLYSWRVLSADERKLFATIDLDLTKQSAAVSIPQVREKIETVAYDRLPVHMYNFDFGSLNFAFPHLRKPKSSFKIGVIDPTFRSDGPLVHYRGEAAIEFDRMEKRNSADTRRYRIDGPGLGNRGGYIWVNSSTGWIEDIEIALPDNPEWSSFKFKLLRVEKMGRQAWEAFTKNN